MIQIMNHNPIYMLDFLRHNDWREEWNHAKTFIDYKKTPLCFTHQSELIPQQADISKSKLLMVLRNYKECLVQTFKWNSYDLLHAVKTQFRDYKIYMDNLAYYDQWDNPKTKLLIYYEDLVEKPSEQVEKIARFFDIRQDEVDAFLAKYDVWHANVLQSYQKQHPCDLPTSEGKKVLFHSQNFPLEVLQQVDAQIKQERPYLWEKYLFRYESL
jgi:hypothetical protein